MALLRKAVTKKTNRGGRAASSPFFFTDVVYKWLESALDAGISEADYWQMTIAELIRAMESKKRIAKQEAEAKASYDYILANLIGYSVSRIYSSSSKMPSLADAYPTIFNSEERQEAQQEKQDELSALRFRQFAKFHNDKLAEVSAD